MKKSLSLLLVLVLCLFLFASCAEKPHATVVFAGGEKDQTFQLAIADYKEGDTLYTAFSEKRFAASFNTDSTPYLTSLCGTTPDEAAGEYFAIYTTDPALAWGDAAFEKDGLTYYYAAYGVNDLPIREGTVYLFRVESFS